MSRKKLTIAQKYVNKSRKLVSLIVLEESCFEKKMVAMFSLKMPLTDVCFILLMMLHIFAQYWLY